MPSRSRLRGSCGCGRSRRSGPPGLSPSANPSLPAILRVGPALLLHLQPPPRRPGLVQARLFLSDQTLVVVRDHLGTRSWPTGAPATRTRCRRRRSPTARADRSAAGPLAVDQVLGRLLAEPSHTQERIAGIAA